MSELRELKVYVSEGLHREVMNEVGHCNCSMSGFVRSAIAREVLRRKQLRSDRQPALEFISPMEIDGNSDE